MQAAARLAAGTGAELAGLFVEDINLLRLAGLPFARETGMLAGSRALGLVEVERALRVEAAQAQRMLAEAARALQANWTFRIARGQMLTEALAESADLLVLVKAERLVTYTSVRPRQGKETPVFVLFDATPAGYRALAVGLKLAQSLGLELVLLVAAHSREAFAQLRQAVHAWLAGEPQTVHTLQLVAPEPGQLGALVRAQHGAALVLRDSSLPAGQAQLDALLQGIGCPLIVVR